LIVPHAASVDERAQIDRQIAFDSLLHARYRGDGAVLQQA
jgi:hypothetical protein